MGIDSTRSMPSRVAPGRASRSSEIAITTSRWMSRSASNAKVSSVTFTLPSMAFSIGTKPRSMASEEVAAITSEIEPSDRRSPAARSGWVSSACSVNVPAGPRNPMIGPDRAAASGGDGAGSVTGAG